ncbi:MAG: hypothetical protein AAFP90_03890 [Planctomycetota bacterium]
MKDAGHPTMDEVELMMVNARLRDELEPYNDESIQTLSFTNMPLDVENDYLASLLAWERAPAIAIAKWFSPRLTMPDPSSLTDVQIHRQLWTTIRALHRQQIVLEWTDHLSDRQLYMLIMRDILPSCEKKVDLPENVIRWRCVDSDDTDTWLTYYATAAERRRWQELQQEDLPPQMPLPHPRRLPKTS